MYPFSMDVYFLHVSFADDLVGDLCGTDIRSRKYMCIIVGWLLFEHFAFQRNNNCTCSLQITKYDKMRSLKVHPNFKGFVS